MLTEIGSSAARHWFPEFREPKDLDFHGSSEDDRANIVGGSDFAAKTRADVFIDERLGQWDWGSIATPEELYTMKVSHSFWEIGPRGSRQASANWRKHMSDIVFFQRKGVEFNRELYDILRPIWKERYHRNPTNLKQNAEAFFGDAVKRKYDHDSIHASIAYGDYPLYEDILVPGEEVMVDSTKFFDGMDLDTQLKLVREEVYATALERIMIPKDYVGSPSAAYAWALQRTITSLFKGEWALWTVLHYDTLARPDCDYVQRHKDNAHRLIPLEDN